MSNMHIGDNNQTFGPNSPITTRGANSQAQSAGPELQALIYAVQVMRDQLPASARQVPNEFLELAGPSGTIDPGKVDRNRFQSSLIAIAAVAKTVGQVGVPVIQAVDKVMHVLGM